MSISKMVKEHLSKAEGEAHKATGLNDKIGVFSDLNIFLAGADAALKAVAHKEELVGHAKSYVIGVLENLEKRVQLEAALKE